MEKTQRKEREEGGEKSEKREAGGGGGKVEKEERREKERESRVSGMVIQFLGVTFARGPRHRNFMSVTPVHPEFGWAGVTLTKFITLRLP